jgi:hypothetical protein
MGGKRTFATPDAAVHARSMLRWSTVVALTLGAGITASCNQQPASNFCNVIRQGPQLAGSVVNVRAWHGSPGGFWDALGSPKCDQLIEPDFDGRISVTAADPQNAESRKVLQMLAEKPVINVPLDFSGDFRGVLEKRTGYYSTRPVPLDAPPPLDEMPYVLHVTSIDNLRIVRKAPWIKPPPASAR